jgi:protein required for attachment to host cells
MADEIINGLIERQVAAAVEQMRDEIKNATIVERERCIGILRDVLCKDLAEFCIAHIRKGN